MLDECRKYRKRDRGVSAGQHALNRLKAFVWMEGGGKKAVEEGSGDAGKNDVDRVADLISIDPASGDRESATGE